MIVKIKMGWKKEKQMQAASKLGDSTNAYETFVGKNIYLTAKNVLLAWVMGRRKREPRQSHLKFTY